MLAPLIPALFKNQLHTTFLEREHALGRERGDGEGKAEVINSFVFSP